MTAFTRIPVIETIKQIIKPRKEVRDYRNKKRKHKRKVRRA